MRSGASCICSAGNSFFAYLIVVLGMQKTIRARYGSRHTGRFSNDCVTIVGTEIALCLEHVSEAPAQNSAGVSSIDASGSRRPGAMNICRGRGF